MWPTQRNGLWEDSCILMYYLHLRVPKASRVLFKSLFQKLCPSFHVLWDGQHPSFPPGRICSHQHLSPQWVAFSICLSQTLTAPPNNIAMLLKCPKHIEWVSVRYLCSKMFLIHVGILFISYLCGSKSSHPFAGELYIQTLNSSHCLRQDSSDLFGSVLPFRPMSCGHQLPLPNRSIYAFLLKERNIDLNKGEAAIINRWVRVSLTEMWEFTKDLKAVRQLAKRFFEGRAFFRERAKVHQERACVCTEQSEEERVVAEEMEA